MKNSFLKFHKLVLTPLVYLFYKGTKGCRVTYLKILLLIFHLITNKKSLNLRKTKNITRALSIGKLEYQIYRKWSIFILKKFQISHCLFWSPITSTRCKQYAPAMEKFKNFNFFSINLFLAQKSNNWN